MGRGEGNSPGGPTGSDGMGVEGQSRGGGQFFLPPLNNMGYVHPNSLHVPQVPVMGQPPNDYLTNDPHAQLVGPMMYYMPPPHLNNPYTMVPSFKPDPNEFDISRQPSREF